MGLLVRWQGLELLERSVRPSGDQERPAWRRKARPLVVRRRDALGNAVLCRRNAVPICAAKETGTCMLHESRTHRCPLWFIQVSLSDLCTTESTTMAASAATSSLLSGALGVFGLASTTRRRRLSSGLQTNAVPVDHTLYGPPAQQGIGSFLARPASQSSLPTPQFPTLEAPSLKNGESELRRWLIGWSAAAATAAGACRRRRPHASTIGDCRRRQTPITAATLQTTSMSAPPSHTGAARSCSKPPRRWGCRSCAMR